MGSWTFSIEQLSNGAWHVSWYDGHGDYGRTIANRAGFSSYEETEKFILSRLRKEMRKHRDALAKPSKAAV